MTTLFQALDGDWVDLVTDLSLALDTPYLIQNIGSSPINLIESAAPPSATSRGHIIEPKETWRFTPEAGLLIFARSAVGGESEAAITKAKV